MSGADLMTEFTPEAAVRLDDYLTEVRAALAGAANVSPDEIEADIREHVAAEFHSAVTPVSIVELEAVLARLGPPDGWATSAGVSRPAFSFNWKSFVSGARRRVLGVFATLSRGPEDWRLTYLTFGLFVLGVVTAPIAIGILPLIVAYLMGRATIELARDKKIQLGARRWLVYPAVLVISLPLLIGGMFWPVAAAPATADAVRRYERVVLTDELVQNDPIRHRNVKVDPEELAAARRVLHAIPGPRGAAQAVAAVFAAIGALAAWWTVVGMLMWAFPKFFTVALEPLLDGYHGGHGLRLVGVAGLAFLIWLGFASRFVDLAGWG